MIGMHEASVGAVRFAVFAALPHRVPVVGAGLQFICCTVWLHFVFFFFQDLVIDILFCTFVLFCFVLFCASFIFFVLVCFACLGCSLAISMCIAY